ncbi:MAG: hypothetical protein ACXAEU_24905 [Candidatus Hodarchaeales archaeon]|jgi:hypothetical protein
MAVEYGMSLVDELKETLARRRNVLEQFELYKRMYDTLIKELQETFQTDEDTVCSALFLSRFVMDGVMGEQKRMSDIARTRLVLGNLLKAREHMPIDLGGLIAVYQLIHEQAIRIEKDMVEKVRLLVKRPVIMTNLVDIYVVSLLSFLEQVNPEMDLRWAMAEIYGALSKLFAVSCYEDIKEYPLTKMDKRVFFDSGAFIIKSFMDNYLINKFDKKELEEYSDIGTKEYEYASTIFYDKKSRNLLLEPSLSEKITLDEQLEEQFKTSLHINHSMFRKDSPFMLFFARFYVEIKTGGKKFERHYYIHNYEEKGSSEDEGIGSWNFLALSSENINLQSLTNYSKQRCSDVRGVMKRLETKKEGMKSKDNILEAWNETYIHNLQEDYQFLSEKDHKREHGFFPVAILKQEHGENNIDILVESKEGLTDRSLRDALISPSLESLSLITPDEVVHLLGHVKFITMHVYEILRLFISQQNSDAEIIFYPVEFLYEREKAIDEVTGEPIERIISILFSTDDSRLVGILGQNDSSLKLREKKSLKMRTIVSKINQLITDLRVKSLRGAREAKLEEFITHGQDMCLETGKLWLSGNVSEAAEKIDAKEIVDDRVREAKKEELERLQVLRANYFNDVIIKHFYTSMNLDVQKKILDFLKKDFSAKLEKEHDTVERQIQQLEAKSEQELGMSKEAVDLIKRLRERIGDDFETSLYKVEVELVKLKNAVEKMSEEDIMNFF